MTSFEENTTLLPCSLHDMSSNEVLEYLHAATRQSSSNSSDIVTLQNAICKKIECEVAQSLTEDRTLNQPLLTEAFRSLNHISEHSGLAKTMIFPSFVEGCKGEYEFRLLYAALCAAYQALDGHKLPEHCLLELQKEVRQSQNNFNHLLHMVKCINLLYRRFEEQRPSAYLPMDCVYYLLQSPLPAMRKEVLDLFKYCAKVVEYARLYFQILIQYWPWTNKYKFYLLSCILSEHRLGAVLLEQDDHRPMLKQLLAGLRLALQYKSLHAGSQHLTEVLGRYATNSFTEMCVDILLSGSWQEICNFHSQWVMRLGDLQNIFKLLQPRLIMKRLGELLPVRKQNLQMQASLERFRLIVIFHIFWREFSKSTVEAPLNFGGISELLQKNYNNLEMEPQLLVLRLSVERMALLDLQQNLKFLLRFIQKHCSIANVMFRNQMLGRMPTIINYLAEAYAKAGRNPKDTAHSASVIQAFFQGLQDIVVADMHSSLYQAKIFALRMLQLLTKSLYASRREKNAKNCSLTKNSALGNFLIEVGVFQQQRLIDSLLMVLAEPESYDDVQELTLLLLQQLDYRASYEALLSTLAHRLAQNNIEASTMSTLHVRAAVDSFAAQQKTEQTLQLFAYCKQCLKELEKPFAEDPLWTCITKAHPYAYLCAINECYTATAAAMRSEVNWILSAAARFCDMVLNFLNLVPMQKNANIAELSAPSFQDMEESLRVLYERSKVEGADEQDNPEDRRYLLMSFWLTLKASCDLATSVSRQLVDEAIADKDAASLPLLQCCVDINVAVLTKCRHKGAIEAAGLSIGRLTSHITQQCSSTTAAYQLLHACVDTLFTKDRQNSTSRRGAGLSIMLLHIIKNEAQTTRPLLAHVMRCIFKQLNEQNTKSLQAKQTQNTDQLEALTLHYLCVLVKDAGLRDMLSKYHDDIIVAAAKHIDNEEWTICNAALQLFGAIVPKVVGQKHANEFEHELPWEPVELTFCEFMLRLPQTCACMLRTFSTESSSSRALILFLSFLSQLEYLPMHNMDCYAAESNCELELRQLDLFRKQLWSLLSHEAEKVRRLAANCFVRLHSFRTELPQALLAIVRAIALFEDEHSLQGAIFVIYDGVLKMLHEALHTVDGQAQADLMKSLLLTLIEGITSKQFIQLTAYTGSKLLLLVQLLCSANKLDFEQHTLLVKRLSTLNISFEIGEDLWTKSMDNLSNSKDTKYFECKMD